MKRLSSLVLVLSLSSCATTSTTLNVDTPAQADILRCSAGADLSTMTKLFYDKYVQCILDLDRQRKKD